MDYPVRLGASAPFLPASLIRSARRLIYVAVQFPLPNRARQEFCNSLATLDAIRLGTVLAFCRQVPRPFA